MIVEPFLKALESGTLTGGYYEECGLYLCFPVFTPNFTIEISVWLRIDKDGKVTYKTGSAANEIPYKTSSGSNGAQTIHKFSPSEDEIFLFCAIIEHLRMSGGINGI